MDFSRNSCLKFLKVISINYVDLHFGLWPMEMEGADKTNVNMAGKKIIN